jgi:citrate lyase subunit beta/citryl-CoA lyase
MITKATALSVDQLFFDLEDAVAPEAKAAARAQVIHALNNQRFLAHTLSLRINDVTTPWCHDDIIEVVTHAHAQLDTIILTKATSVSDVRFVHLLLDQLEQKLGLTKRIGIECLIEEVQGLLQAEAIAGCSDRIETLIFGVGDYAASQQMQLQSVGSTDGYPGDLWHYPRFIIAMACRANGIEPIDGPYADFSDLDTTAVEAQRAQLLGMGGKWAIHPNQITAIEQTFTPSAERIAQARKQKAAYHAAQQEGRGAISVDGVMVDAASIRIIQSLLDRADVLGL